jgi:hypothetical protein
LINAVFFSPYGVGPTPIDITINFSDMRFDLGRHYIAISRLGQQHSEIIYISEVYDSRIIAKFNEAKNLKFWPDDIVRISVYHADGRLFGHVEVSDDNFNLLFYSEIH